MRIKSERDFWAGLMFVVVGVAFAVAATDYSMGPACQSQDPCAASLWARFSQLSEQPGAGYFPLGLSILLAVVGAGVLFKALTFESVAGDPIGQVAWRPLVAVVASVVLFGVMLEPFGLVLTVPVLVVVSSLASDAFRWKGVLVAAVVLTVLSWLIFVWALKLAIPVWPAFVG